MSITAEPRVISGPRRKLDGASLRRSSCRLRQASFARACEGVGFPRRGNVVKITDPSKPFYSHRHTATSYLRNTRLPDGSPAVKEDIERYILGHAGKGAHAGYGKRWFETLKAAVEVIPNPLKGSASKEPIR
jgi:hypothetical protein